MLFCLYLIIIFKLVLGTPPACFLNCVNNVSRFCNRNQADFKCLCKVHEAIYQCINKHCPAEHFYSSRDHFKGTCIEHGFEFESLDEGPFIEVHEVDYDSGEDVMNFDQSDAIEFSSGDSSAEESEDDCDGSNAFANDQDQDQDADADADADADGDSSDEWAGENDWEEGKDWPANDDLSLSGLDEDVIKNYMNYVIKHKPLPRPSRASSRGVHDSGHKSNNGATPAKKPLIVHGPPTYEPPTNKGGKSGARSHKA